MKQGYLCTGPVVRIRKSNDDYILTYKNKKGIEQKNASQSNEVELELTQEAFQHLMTKVDNNLIEKTRYLIPLENGLMAELDLFEGRLQGLYFVEVEFESDEAAGAFQVPSWFGEDVSFDKRFRNTYLSTVESVAQLNLE